MELIFNKADKGQEEIKKLMGFINADLSFKNMLTDISLHIPKLIQIIGLPMYEKLLKFYNDQLEPAPTDEQKKSLELILKRGQLYVLLLAYKAYAPNADLIHGNNGRKAHFAEGERAAWDWQIAADNGALLKRAYKALDELILTLDASGFNEWTDSDQYKTAAGLFIYNTEQLHKVYPIDYSGQLYHQLIPFMEDVELENILAILGAEKFQELKGVLRTDQEPGQKKLINYSKKVIAYRILAKASQLLPEEMLNFPINYKVSETEREEIRKQRSREFEGEALYFESLLEREKRIQAGAADTRDLTHGIKAGQKHVNL